MGNSSSSRKAAVNKLNRSSMDESLIARLLKESKDYKAQIVVLEEKTSVTCGVGSGNGNLFVHGDYDSIKAVQALVFDNERLRLGIGKFKDSEITMNKFDLFELVEHD